MKRRDRAEPTLFPSSADGLMVGRKQIWQGNRYHSPIRREARPARKARSCMAGSRRQTCAHAGSGGEKTGLGVRATRLKRRGCQDHGASQGRGGGSEGLYLAQPHPSCEHHKKRGGLVSCPHATNGRGERGTECCHHHLVLSSSVLLFRFDFSLFPATDTKTPVHKRCQQHFQKRTTLCKPTST